MQATHAAQTEMRDEGVEAMSQPSRTYIPAAGHDWALALYDPIAKMLGGDAARRRLLEQAPILPGHRVLDIGCGTGTLVILIKHLYPDADVVGFDPDPKVIARARRKAARASASVQFDQGFADALPYPDASIDRVLSSFMFHHLQGDEKEGMLREVRRVLRPSGTLNLLDFDGPDAGADGFLMRLPPLRHHLRDNSEGRILGLMRQAGFAGVKKVRQATMLFGGLRLNYYQAAVPASEIVTTPLQETAFPPRSIIK
jgi:ubiquinone/menaquinone biosynthesis C-methylase UbiE